MDSIRTCSVDGCVARHTARGYCNAHYARWKRYGTPDGAAPEKARRSCSVDGCERVHRNWGYCNLHGQRFYRHGDPLISHARERTVCSVDDCEELSKGHGLCHKHLRRSRNNGSPLVVKKGGRPTTGEHPRWDAIHKRVHRQRGRASDQACIDCAGQAAEWSYDNRDAHELIDPVYGIAYSLDIERYQPRCIPCHRAFDAAHRRAVNARLTLTKEREL